MNSRLSPSVEAIDPTVRERAEAAARRAGLSLNDWLNSSAADPHAAKSSVRPPLPDHEARDVAEIHQRLDSITRQIEHMSRPAPRSEPGVAHQLNDAISRLDARLSQLNEPVPQRQGFTASADTIARNTPPPFNPPPIAPGSLEAAIAEITARQNELNAANARATPPLVSPSLVPPIAPSASAPAVSASADLSGLERQLLKITSQIDGLRPDAIEQSIAAFRNELAEIRHTITEAMPRRAIESIENEIRSLSRRIDDSRHNGADGQALAGIERALNEIREVLHSLTPAEQLAGFDTAIRNLGGKIDTIVRASDDPGTIRQLEDAIAALRGMVSHVASNESLGRLSDDVRILAAKVDQFSHPEGFNEGFAALEQRIAALATTLEKRPQGVIPGHSEHLEGALQALSDRLDHLPVGNDSTSAFAHLEQRVSYLLERLEMANDPRNGHLGRVEEGLQDVLRHLERQSASFASLSDPVSRSSGGMDPSVVEAIQRELSEMRFTQTETDRHTQDSLEAVHNTLGHVVDRLAMIESDLRTTKTAQPASPIAPTMPAAPQTFTPAPVAVPVAQSRPELPNPAAMHDPAASAAIVNAAPKAISEILDLQTPRAAAPRVAIDPQLPPDHPLEPGTRRAVSDLVAAPDDAANTADLSREPANASSFIAAARRAAQAAASATAPDKAKRGAAGGKTDTGPSTVTSKIRSLLVGASVVVIVLGSFKMAMTLLDDSAPPPPAQVTGDAAPPAADSTVKPLMQPAPSVAPNAIGRQSLIAPAPSAFPFAQETAPTYTPSPAPPPAPTDITGSINPPQSSIAPTGRKPAQVAIPAGEKLPETIGGPMLRAAALKGDPSAAYEIGVRYAEARGVIGNTDEAAKWYDRAAQAGIVPAMFRLGTLYEKGLSVKKDIDVARRYYTAAAERGNAKAMHNLAVLDADGGAAGANYKSASQWFRKAADRGVADSQYNLGILYARGIGVEQNLAESFKWFSLAAAQGDADSAKKRDDVAKKLDPQSLAAAKLAIQTFTPEPQPDDAVTVASPAGGWDAAPAQAATSKPAPKRTASAPR